MTQLEMLNYAIENGMLDINTIQTKIEMDKKEKIISNHPYSIWQGKDGKWRTKIIVDGKKKLVKKSTEDAVKQAILKHYRKDSEYSLKRCYERWIERQRTMGRSDNTLYRYKTDYNRLIKGTEFETRLIDEVNEEDIALFLRMVAESKRINYKCMKSLFGYIKGTFDKAIRDKNIDDNPCRFVDLQMLKKFCTEKEEKTVEQRILSDDERAILEQKLINKAIKKPNYIPQYAVHLSMYTGFRVGELAGLKWQDISFEKKSITIKRSEKYNRLTKEYYIDDTKNHKVRTFPITDEIEKILKAVWKVESDNEWLGEFVFMNGKGRLHTGIISSAMRNYTLYDDNFKYAKSIHANRRTLNSRLRCNGVSVTVASTLLGHSERVNEENYTYDATEASYKLDVVAKAGVISSKRA